MNKEERFLMECYKSKLRLAWAEKRGNEAIKLDKELTEIAIKIASKYK